MVKQMTTSIRLTSACPAKSRSCSRKQSAAALTSAGRRDRNRAGGDALCGRASCSQVLLRGPPTWQGLDGLARLDVALPSRLDALKRCGRRLGRLRSVSREPAPVESQKASARRALAASHTYMCTQPKRLQRRTFTHLHVRAGCRPPTTRRSRLLSHTAVHNRITSALLP